MCICLSGVRMGTGESELLKVSGNFSRSFCFMDSIEETARTVWCGKFAGMIFNLRRFSHPTSKSSRRSLLMTASTLHIRLLAQMFTVAVPSTCMGSPDALTREGHFSLFTNKFCCCATRYARRETVAPVSGMACTRVAGRPTCDSHT